MAGQREVRVAILGDSRDFNRAVRDVQGGSTRMGRALSGVQKMALGLGAAFAAREVVQFGADLVKAAEESQQVTRQTAAVIRSMGNTAGVTADQVAELSTQLSLKSGIDDELIQSGSNVLLTFRNIKNEVGAGNDIFSQANSLALDLSVALGKDLNSSAIMVGKALNDPLAGITALTRAGVQFTDQQKAQIATLVEQGDLLGAQKIILGELSTQFEGSAEAQATASGKLSVAWGNLKEQLGEKLLPVVESLTTWLAEKLPIAMAFAEEWGRRTKKWVEDNEGAAKLLAAAVGTLLVGAMVAYAASALTAAAATIAATWPILAVVAIVAALAVGLWYAYKNWGWFRSGVQKAGYVLGEIRKVIEAVVGQVNSLRRSLDNALGPLDELLGKVGKIGIGSGFPGVGIAGGLLGFDSGGVVPGPRGAPRMVLAHGGETILPTHKSGFQAAGGGGGDIVIQIGDEVIARVVANASARGSRRGIGA